MKLNIGPVLLKNKYVFLDLLQDNKMTKEMCFYITKEFQENPPQPIDKDVVIKKSSERVVFVKKFGGYAMRDSVWMDNAAAFREEISDR